MPSGKMKNFVTDVQKAHAARNGKGELSTL